MSSTSLTKPSFEPNNNKDIIGYANTPCLPFLRNHSPDGATPK